MLRASRALLLAGLLAGCASGIGQQMRTELDRLYPPGTRREDVSYKEMRLAETVDLYSGEEVDAFVREALTVLGPDVGTRATGYDLYHRMVRKRQGYYTRVIRYCDHVFFDREGTILGSATRKC